MDTLTPSTSAKRPEDLAREQIGIDPQIFGGKPCIRGTRMRVTDVLSLLAHGAIRAEILEDYPCTADDDITAALAFAAHLHEHPILIAKG